ncbi:IS3 family transposase [Corynebacterium cystitidis]|uniref:IS3 family transposase n=2 Tax=Corynebacterium cystitidis TaxID=35757 RepID=UPI00211DB1B9|nr:IS3 family transposase [Corynebacterium cystitidis]
MCRVLEVSRSGYYAWRARLDCPPAPSTPRGHRQAITPIVKQAFANHNGFGGIRTIYADMCKQGVITTRYAIAKVMKDNNLVTKRRRAFKKTTIADPTADQRKDLLQRRFNAAMPTTHLCGDITYLCTGQGWMYLATVIDLTTRMVVGWRIGERMTSNLVEDALVMAHQAGYVAGNDIFHTDRGSQYTSKQFAEAATRMDVRLSIGEVGVCWDNAVAESFSQH